ncbi:permease [Gordoniibacillus kamchatkensis]|uniref:Permease n=1 Tax=Gordoniibacillus kamchatkensis TaxID=1590651 RepID=A0ABR5AFR5_9BACL|nr:hypothetical protein [Paenibacillus sp. VKM B-2647]KIL39898.1 permease [Paenibacillus sp. VKM B-2647]
MFAGHFGIAAAVKSRTPDVPLWALMLSTQLLDVAFVPLLLSGRETIEPVSGDAAGYGQSVIHADYTHSLVGALLIALLAGIAAQLKWRKRSGLIIGGVTFSHWLLDLIVHRADLPLLPGHLDGLPLLGFGLWKYPAVSAGLEVLLIAAGAVLYSRNIAASVPAGRKRAAWAAGGLMAALLALSLITDIIGVA